MSKETRWRSFCDQLLHDLHEVEEIMMELLDHSAIVSVDPNEPDNGLVFLGFPSWGWAKSDVVQTRLQMQGLERYLDWFSRFRLLFRTPTRDVESLMQDADEFVRRWFKRGEDDHSIPEEIFRAKERAQREFESLRSLIGVACPDNRGQPNVIAVPDTNALVDNPDLATYSKTLGRASFDVRLVPTVLGELDELKRSGRTEQARAGANRADRMLKGLRDRGDVRAKVAVTRSVRASFDVAEPTFGELPGWLDPSVPDDRIVASALLLQASNPSAAVVLVTSDLNLQNKAAAVGLPHVSPPRRD